MDRNDQDRAAFHDAFESAAERQSVPVLVICPSGRCRRSRRRRLTALRSAQR
jgi:hypothetical protein